MSSRCGQVVQKYVDHLLAVRKIVRDRGGLLDEIVDGSRLTLEHLR